MIARGVRFDIIGLSYYPCWHGTLEDLQNNLADLWKRYNKPLNVEAYSGIKRNFWGEVAKHKIHISDFTFHISHFLPPIFIFIFDFIALNNLTI